MVHAQQNTPPGLILPGSDLTIFMEKLRLVNDSHGDMQAVLAMAAQNCPEDCWNYKPMIELYFDKLLEFLRSLNEIRDDSLRNYIFVFQLSTNDTKTEYIDHEKPTMLRWVHISTSIF